MKYIVPNRKRLPYGMMNFAVIRRDNYYYVDKTRFIPMIEEADRFFFFIRPRRFGKSLTLNMLQHYYDVRTRDKFERPFRRPLHREAPTLNRNSYLVLYLNFSGISGELNNYRKGLDAHCQYCSTTSVNIYADLLPQGIRNDCVKDGAVEQLDYLYQNANVPDRYVSLHRRIRPLHQRHPFRCRKPAPLYGRNAWRRLSARFSSIKVKAGTYSSIERCFITGVSPVTMDDLTSGFNIGTNYSLAPNLTR